MSKSQASKQPPMCRRDFLAAGLAAIAAGCAKQTYQVLAELPSPPAGLAGQERGAAFSFSPQDPQPAQSVTAETAPSAPEQPKESFPARWIPDVREVAWRHIVIHHSSTEWGNVASFDISHRQRGWDEMGYHFVITNGQGDADGAVEVGSRWEKQKWGAHTGGTLNNEYNNYGVGICLVGDFTDHMPSDAQLASLDRLVRFLMSRYALNGKTILGHRDAPLAKTTCPGDRLHGWLHSTFIAKMQAGRPA